MCVIRGIFSSRDFIDIEGKYIEYGTGIRKSESKITMLMREMIHYRPFRDIYPVAILIIYKIIRMSSEDKHRQKNYTHSKTSFHNIGTIN